VVNVLTKNLPHGQHLEASANPHITVPVHARNDHIMDPPHLHANIYYHKTWQKQKTLKKITLSY